jgi:hypothetical protein
MKLTCAAEIFHRRHLQSLAGLDDAASADTTAEAAARARCIKGSGFCAV